MELSIENSKIFEYVLRTDPDVSRAFAELLPQKKTSFTETDRNSQLKVSLDEATKKLEEIIASMSEREQTDEFRAIKSIVQAITRDKISDVINKITKIRTYQRASHSQTRYKNKSPNKPKQDKKTAKDKTLQEGESVIAVEKKKKHRMSRLQTAVSCLGIILDERYVILRSRVTLHPSHMPIIKKDEVHPDIYRELANCTTNMDALKHIGGNYRLFHKEECHICEVAKTKLHLQPKNGTTQLLSRTMTIACAAHINWPKGIQGSNILDALFPKKNEDASIQSMDM
jgi:hypothetical protein